MLRTIKTNTKTQSVATQEVSSRLLQRGLDILEYLADNPQPVSTTDLAEKLEMHPSTCHRLLGVLKQRGYVNQSEQLKLWSLGVGVLKLSNAVTANLDLRRVAYSSMEELCRLTRETILLGVLNRGEVVYIEKVESPRAVNIALGVGDHLRLHGTALGRILLAYSPPELFQQEIGRGFYKTTPYTLNDIEQVRQRLDLIRQRGYEKQQQESFEGVNCVAAPIFGHDRKIIAAVGIVGPDNRMSDQTMEDLVPALKVTASYISEQMGYFVSKTSSRPL